jgi:hypothetical protein
MMMMMMMKKRERGKDTKVVPRHETKNQLL